MDSPFQESSTKSGMRAHGTLEIALLPLSFQVFLQSPALESSQGKCAAARSGVLTRKYAQEESLVKRFCIRPDPLPHLSSWQAVGFTFPWLCSA